MGLGGGPFIKGLQLGIMIKVALAFLPVIIAKVKSAQSGVAYSYAQAYVSDTRGGGSEVTDPNVIARNIQRQQYKILNSGKPPSLTRRERGKGIGSLRPSFVNDDELNVGITGFQGYIQANQAYYAALGGRR